MTRNVLWTLFAAVLVSAAWTDLDTAHAADPPQIVAGLNLFTPPVRTVRATAEPRFDSPRALNFFRAADETAGTVDQPTSAAQLRAFARAYTGQRWVAQGETTRQQLIRRYGFPARDLAGLSEQDCRAVLGAIHTRRLPAALVP